MRQPADNRIVINPSKSYPWYGWRKPGERFTTSQHWAMERRKLDPASAAWMMVRREATSTEVARFPGSPPQTIYEFECPIIRRERDGRVRVISPGGDEKIVFADGWATRPWIESQPAWKRHMRSPAIPENTHDR